jgi:hypothetical protein
VRHDDVGQRLQRVGGHLEGHGHVVPAGVHEPAAEAGGRCEADGVERPVHAVPALAERIPGGCHLGRVGDVELEHLALGRELAGGALRERQAPSGTGEDDLGPLLLRQTGDAEGQ